MGDLSSDPVAALAVQVNRFGPGAPAAQRFVTTPFPVAGGNLDPQLALVALTIYQQRAASAYAQFQDQGSQQAIVAANAGFADPTAFVQGNLADVTAAVAGYADSLGLPKVAGDDLLSSLGDSGPLLLAGGAALALFMLRRPRRRVR